MLHAYGTDQLYSELINRIKGITRHMKLLREENLGDETPCGFLLIFNQRNMKIMACVVRHKWPSRPRFLHNMHPHYVVLVRRGGTKLEPLFYLQ